MDARGSRLRSDEGVSLVLVLVFMTIVGFFCAVALAKSSAVSKSGVQLRTRANYQYALDGGVDRAFQALTTELASGAPTSCTTVASGASFPATFSLNAQTVDYSCSTLAGRTTNSSDSSISNYALVVTSPNLHSLTSQAGVDPLLVGGSVFLNGKVTNSDLNKVVQITTGDLTSPAGGTCDTDLAAVTQIQFAGTGQLRACTEQTLASTLPSISVATAPTYDIPTTLRSGLQVNLSGGQHCQVFYPGRYTAPPTLSSGDNYFVSGTYYFLNTGQWQIAGGSNVLGGQPLAGTDTPASTGACATMTDAVATAQGGVSSALPSINPYRLSSGNTWVFGGSSSLDFKKGSAVLFTPPASAGAVPVNIVGASSTAGGYTPISVGAAVLTGGTNNTSMTLNSNLYAPTGGVEIFSTNNTLASARAGVVAYTLTLKASNSGSGGLVISSSGALPNPPPPFRTVSVITRDHAATLAGTNFAVATISNFAPYTVRILSWRTG